MSDKIEKWGNEKELLEKLGAAMPLEVEGDRETILDVPLHEEL